MSTYDYVESEVYRTVPIHNFLKQFGSKADLILRHKETNEIHTIEIKASKWDYILTSMNFNAQIIGQQVVNKASKTLVVFFHLTNKPSVQRFEFEFTAEEKEHWKNEIGVQFGQVMMSEKLNIWPRNDTACRRFNQICPFLQLCDNGGAQSPLVQQLIAGMPKKDVFDYLRGE